MSDNPQRVAYLFKNADIVFDFKDAETRIPVLRAEFDSKMRFFRIPF